MLRQIAMAFAFWGMTSAVAFACWLCNDLNYPYDACDSVLKGSEICVLGQHDQSCSLYYGCDNCDGDPDCGCPPEGCPANLRIERRPGVRLLLAGATVPDNCSAGRLRREWQLSDFLNLAVVAQNSASRGPVKLVPGTEGLSREDKVNDFLRRVERGEFSGNGVQVHMDSKGDIAKALISDIPVSHWGAWTFSVKQKANGKYVKTYVLETKSGKTVRIVLDE